MEAKDTLLTPDKLVRLENLVETNTDIEASLAKQAEITGDIAFKAGYKQRKDEELPYYEEERKAGKRKVVEWIENESEYYQCGTCDYDRHIQDKKWQAFLKSEGIVGGNRMIKELTRAKAIKECKKLWAEIERLGISKSAFFSSSDGKNWMDKFLLDCPLCEYDHQFTDDCSQCPLPGEGLARCFSLGFSLREVSSPKWFALIKGLK